MDNAEVKVQLLTELESKVRLGGGLIADSVAICKRSIDAEYGVIAKSFVASQF